MTNWTENALAQLQAMRKDLEAYNAGDKALGNDTNKYLDSLFDGADEQAEQLRESALERLYDDKTVFSEVLLDWVDHDVMIATLHSMYRELDKGNVTASTVFAKAFKVAMESAAIQREEKL